MIYRLDNNYKYSFTEAVKVMTPKHHQVYLILCKIRNYLFNSLKEDVKVFFDDNDGIIHFKMNEHTIKLWGSFTFNDNFQISNNIEISLQGENLEYICNNTKDANVFDGITINPLMKHVIEVLNDDEKIRMIKYYYRELVIQCTL